MANPEQLEILTQGVEVWNRWRSEHRSIEVDLSDANLSGLDLSGANFLSTNLSRANLSGANLSKAKFNNIVVRAAPEPEEKVIIRTDADPEKPSINQAANLQGANLQGANLQGVNLDYVNLYEANLDGANLINANLYRTNLINANLINANLRNSNFIGAYLNEAKLSNLDLTNVDIHGADLTGADLRGVNLTRVNLSSHDLKKANLTGAILSKANLSGCDLSGAILTRADLSQAKLNDANLKEANLEEANLREVNFLGANLNAVNLQKATFNYKVNLFEINLIKANLNGVDLSEANLRGANLRGATFMKSDLSGANLVSCDLSQANLSQADLSYANLFEANLFQADLSQADLSEADLRQTDLSETNLFQADLDAANLYFASLKKANLRKANLHQVTALYANFEAANLTGACIQDWNINKHTRFTNISCDYIYLQYDWNISNYQDRRPHDINKIFVTGDFAKLVEKSIETVDLIFREGIDWKAFFSSFVELQDEANGSISIGAIENKDDGTFVIRLNVPAKFDKAEIETLAYQKYERDLVMVEQRYREQLGFKNEQIEFYRKNNTELIEIIKCLGQRQIHIDNKVITNPQGGATMTGDRNIQTGRDYRETTLNDQSQYAERDINNYSTEQRQTLAEAAAEIQVLLEQLDKTYPTETDTNKKAIADAAIATIDQDPKLSERILSALMGGSTAALDSFLDHPAASFVITALGDWQATKKKPD